MVNFIQFIISTVWGLFMEFYEIKFSFNYELLDENRLDTIFDNIGNLLDVRFDENLNHYHQKNEGEIYELKEVNDDSIEKEMGAFFKFSFNDMIDVPLYKFLVLKSSSELTVLANIHSSIFDYSSVKIIKDLFDNSEEINVPKTINSYFEEYNEYLNSSEFENDCKYWEYKLQDAEDYIKYFDIQSNNYRNICFSLDNDSLSTFLKNHKISKYNFFIAIFSLYLTRFNSTEGCLLKSSINRNNVVGSHTKDTLLMIDYYKNDTFKQYLDIINNLYEEAITHTKVHIENYMDRSFYYSIHDFTNLNDIAVKNGDGSALTFNIYQNSIDIIYNYEVFSEIYIKYLIENIKHLVDNVLDGINQRCGDLEFLSIGDKYDFNGLFELSESQKTIYADAQNRVSTAYNNPIKINLGNSYSVNEVKKAISKLFKLHPNLTSRILDDVELIGFDAKPSIEVGSIGDIGSFVRPFDLNHYLSRFLIVEDDNKSELYLCMDFHTLIFDPSSFNIVINTLLSILNGEYVEFVDDGVLRQISFEEVVNDSAYREHAQEFYNDFLVDKDEANDLVFSVDEDSSKIYFERFDFDNEYLTSFLSNHDITSNQFFTSVFAYTLSRFTGNSKVLFNLVTDGRAHLGLSDSVGMFSQTSPVIMDCENQSIDSFMDYSRELIDSLEIFDLYSFRELAFDYNWDNTISFVMLQDMFSSASGIEFEMLEKDLISNFSMALYYLKENTLGLNVVYSDEYSDNFVKHFVVSFKLILNGLIREKMLSDIQYTLESDIELLDSYNKTEYKLLFDDLIEAFNFNLFKDSKKPLVSFKDRVYNYGQGAFIADKLAKALYDAGVESRDNVAFLVERSELYMFCILGILSTGATYVPLDDEHPDERIKFILDDTESDVAVVSDETYGRASSIKDDVILINISDIVNGEIEELSNLPTVKENIACILYTSGSTGLPKGVKIKREAILNSAESYIKKYNMTNEDVYGLFATIGFNTASLAICQSFYSGACLSIVPGNIKLDMEKLNDYFIEQGVTHTLITTQVAKLYMETIKESPLNVLLIGGEKLGEFNNPNDYHFVNGFGLTEVFSFVSSIWYDEKIDSSSIGMWNFNTKIYIVDDELRRVPVGAVGELCFSGYQVSDGYINREEENIKAFVKNPFDDSPKYEVLLRTGDMVRILHDGTLGFIGRRDSQVKIRGNRLELSEVEAVIREIDFIEDLTVQIIENGSNNELVAYVVVSEDLGVEDLKSAVCDYVDERKPEYMVPSFVIELDSIPLNVNGKVDKRALPAVDVESLRVEYVAPTTESEKLIVSAFEEVFNQDNIGVYDDFTHLGGDSLTAIKVLSYLSDYNVSAVDILSLRTPFAIAENIKKVSLDFDMFTLESGCPLNEPQLNVYLDIVANDKFDIYLIPTIMDIAKDYDVEEILEALDVMLDVHPILGTCISDDNEMPCLIKGFKPSVEFKSDVDDDYILEFLTKPFDLYDSLSRFLVVGNDGDYSLYAVFHHIIFDALSEGVFKEDLQTILDGGSVEVDDSFLKVSAFSQQIQETDECADAKRFYDAMLADEGEVNELLDSVNGDGPDIVQLDLELDLTQFKSFLNKYKVSENVFFTSAFAYTLSRYVGSEKVLFNITENGRGRFNNYNAIGMYVNTLPMLVDCKNQNVSDFMQYVSGLVYDVMKYNYYPFRLLAKEYGVDATILFQFLPEWIDNDESDYREMEFMQEDTESESVESLINDFTVEILQKGNIYSINVLYSEKYSKDMVKHFVDSYKLILKQLISSEKLSDIDYVSESDLELLNSINQTEYSLKYDDLLDAFNDNLSNNPDSGLVSYNDAVYSYSEGAFIADNIAKSLKNMGVKAGDNVAFLVERSELYMFSVLSILSVGATYVPLDDAHPDDRLQFILDDTRSKVVIVSDVTYGRAQSLAEDTIILNISDILNGEIGTLSELPVVYGEVACMLYTSGTTGVPKGVKVTRKSILNVSTVYSNKFDFGSDDVYGLFANIGFDAASEAICQVLCAGACLSIVSDDIKLNVHQLNNYFTNQGVNHCMITTQVGKLFMENIEDTSLEVLMVGGEKLGDFDSPEGYLLIDGFGPTETFAFISSINNSDKIDSSSIGDINYNTKFYVLDEELRRVPVGAVGELYISGYQVADGYLNRDEENAKSFIDNPFDSDEDYGTLYRTGDMVRLLPDKTLAIVGRRDGQVKIRGNRVEMSEIESVMREMDIIDDVAVQTIKNRDNNELVAYIVSGEFDDDVVRYAVQEYVGSNKPDYMIPSYVICLDEIPLNINGKVDKRALPEVDVEGLQVEYVAPSTETEKHIVEAFENVFNQDNISIYDNFARLGGDSLTAIKITSILSKYEISVNAHVIFENKTPYQIAKYIDENQEEYGFYLAKKGTSNQNMFILPPLGGISIVFSKLVDNLEFEGNVYLIDDFKFDLTVDEIKNTDHNMTFEKYWDAIKDIFQDGDIIVGYSLGCLYAMLIVEKLEKYRKIEKCVLIDGTLDFYNDEVLEKEEVANLIEEQYDLGFDIDELGPEDHDELIDKIVEIFKVNSVWDFPAAKINGTPVIYLASGPDLESKFDDIAKYEKFIIIEDTDHTSLIMDDVEKIVKYLK